MSSSFTVSPQVSQQSLRRRYSRRSMADIDNGGGKEEEILFDDFPQGPQYGGEGASNDLEPTFKDDADLFAMVGSAEDEEDNSNDGDGEYNEEQLLRQGFNDDDEDWEEDYLDEDEDEDEDEDDDLDLSEFHPDDIREVDELIQVLRKDMLKDLEERKRDSPMALGSPDAASRLIDSVLEERRLDELEERREARFFLEMQQREDEIRKSVSGRGDGGSTLSPLDVVDDPNEPPQDDKKADS